jgi:hypothetical protein
MEDWSHAASAPRRRPSSMAAHVSAAPKPRRRARGTVATKKIPVTRSEVTAAEVATGAPSRYPTNSRKARSAVKCPDRPRVNAIRRYHSGIRNPRPAARQKSRSSRAVSTRRTVSPTGSGGVRGIGARTILGTVSPARSPATFAAEAQVSWSGPGAATRHVGEGRKKARASRRRPSGSVIGARTNSVFVTSVGRSLPSPTAPAHSTRRGPGPS